MNRSTNRTASPRRSTLSALTMLAALAGGALLAEAPAAAAAGSASPAVSSAKAGTGWLSGRVRDFDGNPAANVLIEIELPPAQVPKVSASTIAVAGTKGSRTAPSAKIESKPQPRFVRVTTDSRGRFHVGNLPDSHATNWVYPVVARSDKFGETVTAAIVRGGDDTSITLEFRPFDPIPTFNDEVPVSIGSIISIGRPTSSR
jgi:hypothetical protein